jgi:hypothetical protein
LSPYHDVTISRCLRINMSRYHCLHITVSVSRGIAMSLYHMVSVSQCPHITMSLYKNVCITMSVSQCLHVACSLCYFILRVTLDPVTGVQHIMWDHQGERPDDRIMIYSHPELIGIVPHVNIQVSTIHFFPGKIFIGHNWTEIALITLVISKRILLLLQLILIDCDSHKLITRKVLFRIGSHNCSIYTLCCT